MVAVALRCDAGTLVSTTVYYALSTPYAIAAAQLLKPDA